MDIDSIEQLIRLVDESSVTDLEIQNDELTIRISKAGSAQGAPLQNNSSAASRKTAPRINSKKLFRSPMVGSFHLRSSEDEPPLVEQGDAVKKDQPLCIIEAMKMLNMVPSDRDGIIEKILVEPGQAVEFGQPLFVIAD